MSLRRPTAMPASPPAAAQGGDEARQPGGRAPTRLPVGLGGGAGAAPEAAPQAAATATATVKAAATALPAKPAVRALSAEAVADRGPTRLSGTARQGLRVALEQVQARFPGLAPDAAEQVRALLAATVPETLTRRAALDWGVPTQRRYGELVEQALQLGQDPQRLAAQGHLQRLHALLQEMAEAIAQQLQPGLLTRFRTSPAELLAQHRGEMDQLRKALAGAGKTLADQVEALDTMQRALDQLTQDLQAHSLAATCLAEKLPALLDVAQQREGLQGALLQRSLDLASAHAHIAGAQALREQGAADLRALSACIQHAVLLQLPAWLEKALHAGRSALTPTLARQLQHDLDALLRAMPANSPSSPSSPPSPL